LFVTGVSNSVLDVSGFTLVQRAVRNEDRVTMFGVMEGLFGVSLLAGSLAGPGLVALLGARGGLLLAGAILPIFALATRGPITRRTRQSPLVEEQMALLRRNPLFAPLPLTALDRLTESLVAVSYDSGDVLMREGDQGDEYVLIDKGEVEISSNGHTVSVCGPGDGVGEIALLRRVSRTATVVARTPVRAYAIDAPDFLAAVAGPGATAAAEALVTNRLARSDGY
jgi:hypothetical protein